MFVLDRLADFVPTAAERYSGFLPRQLAGPVGQKQHVGLGQLMFADRPWQFFNPHAAGSAIDPPLDALHVAAALNVGAEELITTEKRGRPLHRTMGILVRSIQADLPR